ncbi:M23 family metallopeptidase [Blastomonas marina]|uniref:M23 family metallopeptidase n=1 Tax=Blastomonas marina TaxID=1867408 RepID=UPI002AC8953C|nr:M23 family metallopeptidase [Blastomonas marina]WPZ03556.1 M23 family metallopeptidase [Blastomonas marina]
MIGKFATSIVGASLLAGCAADRDVVTEAPPQPTVTSAPVVGKPAPTPAATDPAPSLRVTGQLTQGGFIRGTASRGVRSVTLDGEPLRVADDGSFFAAFDRDADLDHTLVAIFANKRIERHIAITARDWDIERVNVARRPGGMTDAFWRIREPEWKRIVAARAEDTGATGWKQEFLWPATGRISGMFGSQRIYQGEPGSYHSGIDIAGGEGTTYVAPADGVVVLATPEPFSLEGYLLIIDHGNGLNSAFLHNSAILVREGETVKRGQPIGRIGASGRATGPHLHWSIKWRDARLDPILFTGPM